MQRRAHIFRRRSWANSSSVVLDVMRFLQMVISPLVGLSIVPMMLSIDVLPPPLLPRITTNSPRRIRTSTPALSVNNAQLVTRLVQTHLATQERPRRRANTSCESARGPTERRGESWASAHIDCRDNVLVLAPRLAVVPCCDLDRANRSSEPDAQTRQNGPSAAATFFISVISRACLCSTDTCTAGEGWEASCESISTPPVSVIDGAITDTNSPKWLNNGNESMNCLNAEVQINEKNPDGAKFLAPARARTGSCTLPSALHACCVSHA